MGKKAFQINIDRGTLKNIGKNVVGAAGYAMGGLPGLAVSSLVNDKLFGNKGGGGGGGGPGGEGISEISKRYAGALEEQRLKNLQVGGQLTEQLRQQAMGEGPLAGAQLKAAQTRNLAQTLAAAQSMGGSPLATRQMLQQRGQQGQELAQLGLQERMGAQQALGQQLATQAGVGRADIMAGFDISKAPAQMAQEAAMQRAQIQAQQDAALRQQQSGILGGLLQGGATIGAAALMSDEDQKEAPESDEDKSKQRKKKFIDSISGVGAPKDIGEAIGNVGKIGAALMSSKEGGMKALLSDVNSKELAKRQSEKPSEELPTAIKEVNDMMDKLEPKKYQYKNPELPGAAPGTRYGIIAQDLEKSSLGKTLVKNTQHGKMIDTVQGFGAVLAAQAELNRRLKKLEKK